MTYVPYDTKFKKCDFSLNLRFETVPSFASTCTKPTTLSLHTIMKQVINKKGSITKNETPKETTIHIDEFMNEFDLEKTPIFLNEVSIRKIHINTFDEGIAFAIISKDTTNFFKSVEIPVAKNLEKVYYLASPKSMPFSVNSITGAFQCKNLKDVLVGFKCTVVNPDAPILTTDDPNSEIFYVNTMTGDYEEEMKKITRFTQDIASDQPSCSFNRIIKFRKNQNHALINGIMVSMKELAFNVCMITGEPPQPESYELWYCTSKKSKYIVETKDYLCIPECVLLKAAMKYLEIHSEFRPDPICFNDLDLFYFNPKKRTDANRTDWKGPVHEPDSSNEPKECFLKVYWSFYVDMSYSLNKEEAEKHKNKEYYPVRFPSI